MRNFKMNLMVLSFLLSSTSFAGPSLSGGTIEAPWVRAQDIAEQVENFASENRMKLISMDFYNKRKNQVLALASCGDGTKIELFFDVADLCRETPVMCIPYREVTLNAASENCN